MILPIVGTAPLSRRIGLAQALFTPVQQRVLALLFGQPDRRYQSAELIRLAKSGTGAVHRQLARLADAGLVTVTRDGNQKYYQANRESPVFEELHSLITKTVGLAEPLRHALGAYASEIRAAFIHGSAAKRTDSARSDIDLMVVSDSLSYPDVYDTLQPVEVILARPVNPTVMTPAEWREKRASTGSFVDRIASRPRLFIIGSPDDLE